jgi:hypothetical protein
LLVLLCDRIQKIAWVGNIDLEVEFIITDASTGSPISGAHIDVLSEGGFYDGGHKHEWEQFIMVADSEGRTSKECRNSMCCGIQSGLRFTDTFAVHMPWWLFRATAPGYESSEREGLNVLKYSRQVIKVGPRQAKVVVPVPLHKSLGEPGAPHDRSELEQ